MGAPARKEYHATRCCEAARVGRERDFLILKMNPQKEKERTGCWEGGEKEKFASQRERKQSRD